MMGFFLYQAVCVCLSLAYSIILCLVFSLMPHRLINHS